MYNEFMGLLSLPNDTMYKIIDNIKSDNYTYTTEINEHKLNIQFKRGTRLYKNIF